MGRMQQVLNWFKTKPKPEQCRPVLLDNPAWHDRLSNVLVTNSITVMPNTRGVGIRSYSEKENAVLIYPLMMPYRPLQQFDDYLQLEWYDTHDDGITFIPVDTQTIKEFLQKLAQNGQT